LLNSENKKEIIEIINKKTPIKKTLKSKSKSPLELQMEMEKQEMENISVEDENKYKRICTVTNWSQFRSGKAQFQLQYSNIHLCNYILFSSVAITEDSSQLSEEYKLQPIQHNDYGKQKKQQHLIYPQHFLI
jgi:hypothetical protein